LLLPLFEKDWDDLIFTARNKNYGAYQLRRLAASYQSWALLATIAWFVLFILWIQLGYDDSNPLEYEFEKVVEFKGFDANLISVKPLKKEQSPPPPPEKTEDKPKEAPKKDNLPPEVKRDVPEPEQKTVASVDTSVKKTEKTGLSTGNKTEAGLDSGIVETYEEGPASPYGGLAEFMRWVQQNLVVPKEARDNGVHGTVYVHFTISEKGEVTKVTLSKGIGFGCDEAVMDVVKRAPKWKPAVRDGKVVSQRFIIPIKI
jgi:periplasmic protein TonB